MDRGDFGKAKIILGVIFGIILATIINEIALEAKSGTASAAPMLEASPQVYYSDTIKNIILSDCSQRHSGPSRNLMDYDNLKAYADSGILGSMVQGLMAGYAGNDAQTILDWIDAGASEKPSTTTAGFTNAPCPAGPGNLQANGQKTRILR